MRAFLGSLGEIEGVILDPLKMALARSPRKRRCAAQDLKT
jgi:hypothetical protein